MSRTMNGIQTRAEMQRIDSRLTDLNRWKQRLGMARKLLLISNEDRDRRTASTIENGLQQGQLLSVRDTEVQRLLEGWNGRGLSRIEADIGELDERRRLLGDTLPSPKLTEEAERRAAVMAQEAKRSCTRFSKAWKAHMAALAAAEETAVEAVTLRNESQRLAAELRDLVDEFGLEGFESPREAKPDPRESEVAGLLGLLLRDAGYSQSIEPALVAELNSAREQAKRNVA